MKKGYKPTQYYRICHNWDIAAIRPSSATVIRLKEKLGFSCECGENDRRCIELHHVVPLCKGGTNHLDNLKCVCANCHRKAHS